MSLQRHRRPLLTGLLQPILILALRTCPSAPRTCPSGRLTCPPAAEQTREKPNGKRKNSLMKITVFSDYICPFCYIGVETLRRLQPEVPPFTLEWQGFQIHPEYPATGLPTEQRMAQFGRERYEAIWQNILSLAANVGLTMQRPPLLTNSLMALEATEFAKEQGKEEAFSRAVYKAYFQEGKNIGDPEVILAIAAEAGLNPNVVQTHLQQRTYASQLEVARREARTHGVSGVPTFIVGPAQIVGAQAPDVFIKMLKRAAERGLA